MQLQRIGSRQRKLFGLPHPILFPVAALHDIAVMPNGHPQLDIGIQFPTRLFHFLTILLQGGDGIRHLTPNGVTVKARLTLISRRRVRIKEAAAAAAVAKVAHGDGAGPHFRAFQHVFCALGSRRGCYHEGIDHIQGFYIQISHFLHRFPKD